MMDYDKNKWSSYIRYWDVKNLYEWAMSQTLDEDGFKWFQNTSQFNKDFMKELHWR